MDLTDPALVLGGQSCSRVNRESGTEIYDIYVPVYLDGAFAGILLVGTSMGTTAAAVRTTTLLVFAGTSFACLIFVYTMFANFHPNQQLVHLAYHHSLTGLPNKVYLEEP